VLFALAAAMLLGVVALLPASVAAPPSGKVVELICGHGLRAGAGGTYGGVAFNISCNNGRSRIRIAETGLTDYTVRMGVESDTTAFDCFFSGDAAVVNENCAGVQLRIR
jgi:hypothetical protein